MNNSIDQLHLSAISAREKSYSPYSNFKVGSALQFKGSKDIFSGCNVENSSYGGCICAERVAILKGLSELGKAIIEKIIVVTASPEGDNPCGLCLQTINEFSDSDTEIIIANLNGIKRSGKIKEYLPKSFDSNNLP